MRGPSPRTATVSTSGRSHYRGDVLLYPLLTAAAEIWKNCRNILYYTRGFLGQGYDHRPRMRPPPPTRTTGSGASVTTPTWPPMAVRSPRGRRGLRGGDRRRFPGVDDRLQRCRRGHAGQQLTAGAAPASPFINQQYVVTSAYMDRFSMTRSSAARSGTPGSPRMPGRPTPITSTAAPASSSPAIWALARAASWAAAPRGDQPIQ